MSKYTFPRFEILRQLDALTADITPNRFITTRPNAVGEQMEEFLLIRLPQPMRDQGDTYQSTYGQINVFVRDIQTEDSFGVTVSGIENTFRLEELQQAVIELFPIVSERFSAIDPILLNSGADGAGFHSLIIQFSITINKKPIN